MSLLMLILTAIVVAVLVVVLVAIVAVVYILTRDANAEKAEDNWLIGEYPYDEEM